MNTSSRPKGQRQAVTDRLLAALRADACHRWRRGRATCTDGPTRRQPAKDIRRRLSGTATRHGRAPCSPAASLLRMCQQENARVRFPHKFAHCSFRRRHWRGAAIGITKIRWKPADFASGKTFNKILGCPGRRVHGCRGVPHGEGHHTAPETGYGTVPFSWAAICRGGRPGDVQPPGTVQGGWHPGAWHGHTSGQGERPGGENRAGGFRRGPPRPWRVFWRRTGGGDFLRAGRATGVRGGTRSATADWRRNQIGPAAAAAFRPTGTGPGA